MKCAEVVLVNPPRVGEDVSDLAPPLWALALGGIAARRGLGVCIVDLCLDVVERGEAGLIERALREILSVRFDIIGLSSMAVDAHVALEMADTIRRARPEAAIVLGGAHFASIAPSVVEHWCVDGVAIGPAEGAFSALVDSLLSGVSPREWLEALPVSPCGVWGRQAQASARGAWLTVRGVSASFAAKPAPPDYDLIELARYFRANPRRVLDVDAGRGCRYRCTYCYAPVHLGPVVPPTPSALCTAFADARRRGARSLFLVQDNFINDPAAAVSACRAIQAAGLATPFQCYATLNTLLPEVVEALAGAGCTTVYVGVDVVDKGSRRAWRKAFFRSEDALVEVLVRCLEAGITPTFAFLLAGPEQPQTAAEEVLATAARVRLLGGRVMLNSLTLYPGTELFEQNQRPLTYVEHKTRLCMDLPEVVRTNRLAQVHPELFPFHSTPYTPEEAFRFQRKTHAAYTLLKDRPRTLAEACGEGLGWWLVTQVAQGGADFMAQDDRARRCQELDAVDALVASGRTPDSVKRALVIETAIEELSMVEPAEWVQIIRPHRLVEGVLLVVTEEGIVEYALNDRASASLVYALSRAKQNPALLAPADHTLLTGYKLLQNTETSE